MLLTPAEAQLFFKVQRTLLAFLNQRLQVVAGDLADPARLVALPQATLLKLREAFVERTDLIESFAAENPLGLPADELAIIHSWRHRLAGKFYIFRQLKKHMVFLASARPPVAYGVVALTQPFEEVIGPHLPVLVEALLLPFRDRIVYDGVLSRHPISFGPGIRRLLNESFQEAKRLHGIVTALPRSAQPPTPLKPARPRRPAPPRATADPLPVIVGLIDQFCRTHLNQEYAALCRALAEKLARKRPSPLANGKPATWACGIIRTIGWVNFLDDREQTPHLKLTAIDQSLGVGESTGQGKAMLIRRLFKIRPLDPTWTLPSQQEDNPLSWMVEVNGFQLDARFLKRELQEEAFRKGLIPYLPEPRSRSSFAASD